MVSAVLTGGIVNDTTLIAATLQQIRVPRIGRGRPGPGSLIRLVDAVLAEQHDIHQRIAPNVPRTEANRSAPF